MTKRAPPLSRTYSARSRLPVSGPAVGGQPHAEGGGVEVGGLTGVADHEVHEVDTKYGKVVVVHTCSVTGLADMCK